MSAGRIESVRIRGFRSLADVELSNLQNANVLIGANGSGKSNFIRFFEMMRWMLRSRRLGEFVELHGGADDQLYGGNSVTPRMEGELALRTDKGRNDYRLGVALLRRRPRELRRASRQELLDASKAWWGGWRGRLADRRRRPFSVSLGVIPLVFARFVEVPVRVEVAAGP